MRKAGGQMRTIPVRLDNPAPILLGRQGDHTGSVVVWNIARWQRCHGDGRVTLLYTLDGAEDILYPCRVRVDGDRVEWLVTPDDLAIEVRGKCQLVYTVGDVIVAYSPVYPTRTAG